MASGLKIAVIGAGGVGGFVCSMLASHLPGVTVVARGDRGRAISERGLVLHSDYKGEITAHPAVVPSVPDLGNGDAMDVIFSRKSVRHYTDQEVEADKLLTLVKAGMAAPTAMNRQPWSFIIVTNMAQVASINDRPGLMMLKKAKAVILVLGKKDEKFWQQDCSAATENILLAAEALGLGAVWCAGYPMTDRTESYKELFNYSDDYEVLSLISIGYSTGEDQPKDKYKEEKIHWNRW